MSNDKNNKNLDELIKNAIGRDGLKFDFDKWKNEHKKEVEIFNTKKAGQEIQTARVYRIGRIIMKSKIFKIASVAIIAILVGWMFLFSPLSSNNQVWAKMLENMKEMNWIYFDIVFDTPPEVTEKMTRSNIDGLPLWMNCNSEIMVSKKLNGELIYTDFNKQIQYSYSPDSNTITIDSQAGPYNASIINSPSEVVEYYIDLLQDINVPVHTKFLVQDDRKVETIQFSVNGSTITGIRDVDTNLLKKIIFETDMPEENSFKAKTEVNLLYLDEGPVDIYDVGAPAAAQIIDLRQQRDADEVLRTIQIYYDNNYGNRICMLLRSRYLADFFMGPFRMIISRKQDGLYRADYYCAEKPLMPNTEPQTTIYEQIKDTWPDISIEEALRLENSNCVVSQEIFDGKTAMELDDGPPAKSLRLSMSNPAKGPRLALEQDINSRAWINTYDLGINNSRIAETVTRLPDNPEYAGLIGLEISHESQQKMMQREFNFKIRYELWIDIQKDYMIMHRRRIHDQYENDKIVQTFTSEANILEAAQTPDGQWYPVHVETKMHDSSDINSTNDEINDIFIKIDTNWATSEDIFNRDYVIGSK